MRKLCILVVLLMVCLFTFSCQNYQHLAELYAVSIKIDSHGFKNLDLTKYDMFSMNETRYDNSNIAKQKQEIILNNTFTLSYLYSISSGIDSYNLDYYYDSILDCQIAYSTLTGKISQIDFQNATGTSISYEQSVTNFDNYFLWLKSVINEIVEVHVDDYTFVCRSHYLDGTAENSSISSLSDTNSQVDFYYFEFAKYVGKYKSAERVSLIARPDGSLKSIAYFNIPYNNLENIIIKEKTLDQTIEKAVHEIFSSNYTVKSMIWQYYKGNPYLMCTVEITNVDFVGEEVKGLIILLIDPTKVQSINCDTT